MKTPFSKRRNSLARRGPRPVAETADLCDGDPLDLGTKVPGVFRGRKPTYKPSLEELVARITHENHHEETDWSEAVGNEAW